MATITKDNIKQILEKVTSGLEVQNWQYTQEKFEDIAQNYFGIIVPVVVSGECKGEAITLQLVLKLAPTDERYRVSGAVKKMFAREVFVYNVMLPAFQEIQDSMSTELHYVIPRCYYTQKDYCNEAIVMQNMFVEGYRPFTHQMFLDLDHIIISLKSLAKFHAFSFILRHRNLYLYSKILNTCVPLTERYNMRYIDIMENRLDKTIILFEGTKYIKLLQTLKKASIRIFQAVITSVQKTCLCHGDIWKENIMFKYEDNKPISACLIDYQTTRRACPAFDVLYLILSSTTSELRHTHYHQLLDIYYETFDQMLVAGGLESRSVYCRQMLNHELTVVAPACVITANCALWLSNGLQEEGHVRSKITFSSEEEKNLAVNRFKGIMQAILDDCCSYDYMIL